MKALKLEKGRLAEFPQKLLRLDEADFESTLELFLFSVWTRNIVLIFPFNGLFPLTKKGKSFNFVYWNSRGDFNLRKEDSLIFWPRELKELSLKRPQDFIIGNRNTTTVSYLEEVKAYLMNIYTDHRLNFCFNILVTDIHWPRVRRDFERLFNELSKKRIIGVIPYFVKVSAPAWSLTWIKKNLLGLKEWIIYFLSNFGWEFYRKVSLRKGGTK